MRAIELLRVVLHGSRVRAARRELEAALDRSPGGAEQLLADLDAGRITRRVFRSGEQVCPMVSIARARDPRATVLVIECWDFIGVWDHGILSERRLRAWVQAWQRKREREHEQAVDRLLAEVGARRAGEAATEVGVEP